MSTTPNPEPLDIRTPAQHLRRAFYLLLAASHEQVEVQQIILGTARECCEDAEAAIEGLRSTLEGPFEREVEDSQVETRKTDTPDADLNEMRR